MEIFIAIGASAAMILVGLFFAWAVIALSKYSDS